MFRICLISLLAALLLIATGCQKSPAPEFRFNEVEWIKQEKTELGEDGHFDPSYRRQIGTIVTTLFGTPDDPQFPYLLGEDDPAREFMPIENLQMAAGAVLSDREGKPQGLYREHCAHCHGISGDGAGPTAAFLNPYPRDFRLGKFKFKSTPLRQPPTDEDLVRILRNGIPGTAMPSFRTLDPQEIEALVDYVKYLTIRGQFERALIEQVTTLDKEPLIDLDNMPGPDADEASVEEFQDQLYVVVYEPLYENELLSRWFDADENVTEVESAPESFKLTHADHQQLVAHGKRLFAGKANCVQCHGETGMGDGQTENYDDWTNDWLKSISNPNDPQQYQPYVDAGAFPPRPIRPRNLRVPVFRGGSHPDDVFRRIQNGIEGTPMPSSSVLTAEEVWALVAYVQAMPYEQGGQERQQPINAEPIH